MKAAFLTAIKKVEIREFPVPEPGEGEALVRVRHVGVCGSDVHYYLNGRIGGQVVEYPFIIGHEAAGVVEKLGKGVKDLKEGAEVAVEPARNCRRCNACLRGKPNLCRKVEFLGTPPVAGAYREYMVMPRENLLPLPEGVGTEEGALAEPLAIGLYAVELAKPPPGCSAAVFGCGPIGISIIISSLLAGAGKVIAVEKIGARLDFASLIGADCLINPDDIDPVTEIMRLTGGEGADILYEAAGESEALINCAESAALSGKVIIAGIPEGDFWEVPAHSSRKKELLFQNVRRAAFTPEKIISLIASGRIEVKKMVTHRFPLERVQDALELAAGYGDGVVKAMIEV